MRYVFKEWNFDEACALWRTIVLAEAKKAPGLVRMEFLTSSPQAMAIGIWEEKANAESFMRTGVFKRLMEKLSGMIVADPKAEQWELDSFIG